MARASITAVDFKRLDRTARQAVGLRGKETLVRFTADPDQSGSPRVLFVTDIYPDEICPHHGSFIESQAASLREAGATIDLLHIRGSLSIAAYARALTAIPRRADEYDVLHVHHGHTAAAAAFARRPPTVFSFYGDDLLGARRSDGITMKSRIEVALFRQVARLADRTITKSVEMEQALPESVRGRNTVLPDGVDLQRFRWRDPAAAREELGWDPRGRVLLFLGDPGDRRKNLNLAEEAATLVGIRRPDTRLEIVWKMPAERIPTVMNAANVLVFPSRSEGSPNAVKEAMASELPIVSTDVGDVAARLEGLRSSSVEPAEPRAFARAIEVALDHGHSPAARRAIAPLSTERTARRLLTIYGAASSWPTGAGREQRA
jgi:teichuronic acid biosynthesis glycosyltransferase TuaC